MPKKQVFKKPSRITLKIIATILAIFYAIIFIGEITPPFFESTFGVSMVYVLFCFFLLGYYFLWKNEKISGIILILWYGFLLLLAFFVWSNAGMVIVLGIPIPILGALLLIKTHFKKIKNLILK